MHVSVYTAAMQERWQRHRLPVAAVLMVFARHLHLRYIGSEYYTEEPDVDDGVVEVQE